jgi:VanZ family protein
MIRQVIALVVFLAVAAETVNSGQREFVPGQYQAVPDSAGL